MNAAGQLVKLLSEVRCRLDLGRSLGALRVIEDALALAHQSAADSDALEAELGGLKAELGLDDDEDDDDTGGEVTPLRPANDTGTAP